MSTRKISFTYRATMIAFMLAIVLSLLGAGFQPASVAAAAAQEVTFISIVGVSKNNTVTIQVDNMLANTQYRVMMNKIGTQGEDGAVAGTARTDRNGSFKATFDIPSAYRNLGTIAIRIEAVGNPASYAYNWFVNSTSGSSGSSDDSDSDDDGDVVATTGNVSLVSLIEDVSVTISAKNAPANTRISVYMDWRNNQGQLKSAQAGTVLSKSDGTISATVKFPKLAKDRPVLSVRLQSGTYKASIWFLNASTKAGVGGGAPSSDPAGIPYITVVEVIEGEEVTIELRNLPLRKEFNVLMSNASALGAGGVKVGTAKTNSKGAFEESFDIPRSLRNRDNLAIRIEAADGSGYYAFTVFENETTD